MPNELFSTIDLKHLGGCRALQRLAADPLVAENPKYLRRILDAVVSNHLPFDSAMAGGQQSQVLLSI